MNDCVDLFPFLNPAGCTAPHMLRSGGRRDTVYKLNLRETESGKVGINYILEKPCGEKLV